jgi:hypothetical protein
MSFSSDLDFMFNIYSPLSAINYMSMSSSKGSISLRRFQTIVTYDEPITDKIIKETSKYSKIIKKYHLLPPTTRRQLDALFNEQYQWPGEIRLAFGKHCGLACFTNPASQCKDVKQFIRLTNNLQIVKQIQQEISSLYDNLKRLWNNIN